jgi:phosphoribosylaminoimidazolecarboxamide formyltransferase/IMP cyclohydrolase
VPFLLQNKESEIMNEKELVLRYGCNPHQKPARVYARQGTLPFSVLNGAPGYINLLDALNAWQLVKELKSVLQLPAAASFKHVSPAGAALGIPLSETVKQACGVEDLELTPLASAYARARGADRLCSFGDFAALSDIVDLPTAQILSREVSDGVIAPGYEPEALALLKKKRQGSYLVLQIDPDYEPEDVEMREVFGVSFEQKRNTVVPGYDLLGDIQTKQKELSDAAKRDMLVAYITLKYTQSNSICFAVDGQSIGIGAGQQSRIHCTRLAASKAEIWYLRQHPTVLNLPWKKGVKRQDKVNAIDLFLRDDLTASESRQLAEQYDGELKQLTAEEKRAWLNTLHGVALGSDGFIPFSDSIECGSRSGVQYVIQPGGSIRDEDVISACDEYGMVMVSTGLRLFHH